MKNQARNEQEPAATTESAGAKRRCTLQPDSLTVGVRKAQATARQGRRDRNGRSKPAVDVATAGMETRCPEGAGPGQRSRPGAKHDSPGSRQGSRPSSEKSAGE
ncbi:hypothetical protein GFW03_15255 [Salmonella enterica]|nr:hypothetical protein [Salmonella enterica]EDC8552029.1 hypothetical protein [Salmonella enterica subsp. enterica serovar Muenchen]EDQ0146061.1 hypothetical protein [Salmonella enterica subsp. enterica serovar Sandiego]EDV8336951.1 hypothetical protein [Salmonella enterica subsp. enterica serovar Baildon]EEE1667887.1 hypothetical protein [Salmonella enterica subsp. houtenae serovar 48:z4,z32:-]